MGIFPYLWLLLVWWKLLGAQNDIDDIKKRLDASEREDLD